MNDALSMSMEALRPEHSNSVGDQLIDSILTKIASGAWPIGFTLPSEGDLVDDFSISRIAVRECILKLRALGVVNTSRGRRTVVAKIDSSMLGRLFPLILANEGPQSFDHVFQLRLLIESDSGFLAARLRTDEELAAMEDTLKRMLAVKDEDVAEFIEMDRLLHLQIARASRNPLYPMLVEALWGFLHLINPIVRRNCQDNRILDEQHHKSIVEAIALQNPERARVELEAHLLSSADHIRKTGVLEQLKLS